MSEKMRPQSEQQYRKFREAQREAHALAVQVQTKDVPARVADWWSDIRRLRQSGIAGALRKIDTLCLTGHPDLAVQFGELVLWYAKDQADDSHGQAA